VINLREDKIPCRLV